MQVGGVSVQKPVEVHVTVCVPFRENPSLQEKKHWEPKLKFCTGWEQFMERDEGRMRMASHCMAAEQKGYKTRDDYQVSDNTPTLTLASGQIMTPNA